MSSGGKVEGLLSKLATFFQRVDSDKFLYLPTRRLVDGAQPAVYVFTEHVDVYFKFLASSKPKGSGREEFEEQLVGLLPQLTQTAMSEEELATCLTQEAASKVDAEVDAEMDLDTGEAEELITEDFNKMIRGWLGLSNAEAERRLVLRLTRNNKKNSPDLLSMTDELKSHPTIEAINFAWDNNGPIYKFSLKCELLFTSAEDAISFKETTKLMIKKVELASLLSTMREARKHAIAHSLFPSIQDGKTFRLFNRLGEYLSHCADTYHFPSKVLLVNLPEYLADIKPSELSEKIEKHLGDSGWAELLLSVKVLHTPQNVLTEKELVLTFIDPASAQDFAAAAATSPALTWPGPHTSPEDGPPIQRFLLSDIWSALSSLRQLNIATESEVVSDQPNEQVVILLPREDYKLAETCINGICESWSGVKQIHHVPVTAAHFLYDDDPSKLVWKPAALVTLESGEKAAAVVAELVIDGGVAVVMLYSEYLTLPAKPVNEFRYASFKKKSAAAKTNAEGAKNMTTQIVESEREIVSTQPDFMNRFKLREKMTKAEIRRIKAGAPKPAVAAAPAKVVAPAPGSKKSKAKQGPLATVVVCWLKNNQKKWRAEDAKEIKKYFDESYPAILSVRIHPKYPTHFFIRFTGETHADTFAGLPLVKYKGVDVQRKLAVNHKFSSNESVIKLVTAKEKFYGREILKIEEEMATAGQKHVKKTVVDLRTKLSSMRGPVTPSSSRGPRGMPVEFQSYAASFAPYGYGPAAVTPWAHNEEMPASFNNGRSFAQQTADYIQAATGFNLKMDGVSGRDMGGNFRMETNYEDPRSRFGAGDMFNSKMAHGMFDEPRHYGMPSLGQPSSYSQPGMVPYEDLDNRQFVYGSRMPEMATYRRNSDDDVGRSGGGYIESMRLGGRNGSDELGRRNGHQSQRPVGAREEFRRSTGSLGVSDTERGLVFSGFSAELSGDIILDVLQGELGVTAREIRNLEWGYKNGKISFQVALSLPSRVIEDLMKQWNLRPLQIGSDLIRANCYSLNKGLEGGQTGIKRGSAAASSWTEPPMKKNRMGVLNYSY